MEDKLVQDSL